MQVRNHCAATSRVINILPGGVLINAIGDPESDHTDLAKIDATGVSDLT